MKKIFAVLLCILLLSGCAQTYDGPTESKLVLTEYEVQRYSTFDDTVWTDRTTFAYDIYGNQVRQLAYTEGELAQETRTKFDEQGNAIAHTTIDHTNWIPLVEDRGKQTYDDQGRLLTSISYDMWGRETGRSVNVYDDENHTMTWSNDTGDQVIYYYDENGLLLRDVSTGVGGCYETLYEYDERGNRIGWTSTRDGAYYSRYEAGYDDQDRQIWGVRYDENGDPTSPVTYTYDDEAHKKTITKADGSIRVEFYDDEGRIHLIEDYNENGLISIVQQYSYRDILVPASAEE